jgi:hypothetical protein
MAVSAPIQQTDPPPTGSPGHAARRYTGTSFRQVLAAAFDSKAINGSVRPMAHHVAAHVRLPPQHRAAATPVPSAAATALTQAMAAEDVPASWQPSLAFIMAHESSGKVGVQSPVHSARGLYQLTAANYHYNPNGAASFGNGVEEARGGIRYIRARYGSAEKAAAFWRTHHWY